MSMSGLLGGEGDCLSSSEQADEASTSNTEAAGLTRLMTSDRTRRLVEARQRYSSRKALCRKRMGV